MECACALQEGMQSGNMLKVNDMAHVCTVGLSHALLSCVDTAQDQYMSM